MHTGTKSNIRALLSLSFSLLRRTPPPPKRSFFSLRLITTVCICTFTGVVQADDYFCYDVYKDSGTGVDLNNTCFPSPREACKGSLFAKWTNNSARYVVSTKWRPGPALCNVNLDNGNSEELGIIGTLETCPGDDGFNYDMQACDPDLSPTIIDLYAVAFTAIAFLMVILGVLTAWSMNRR